jgi:hypothetical protein
MKVLMCLGVLSLIIIPCFDISGQTPKKNDQSAEWEYKQLYSPDDEVINRYAKEGWDIAYAVGVAGDSNSAYRVILKRHKSHALFGTQIGEYQKPEPPSQISKCKLTLAQAPVIRGLRFGMTSDELFTIFPPNEREEIDRTQQLNRAQLPPNYGFTKFQFFTSRSVTKDRFTGVSNLYLGLLDRKVVYIGVEYSNTPQFERIGQLIEVISTYKKIVEDRRQADLAKKRAEFKF